MSRLQRYAWLFRERRSPGKSGFGGVCASQGCLIDPRWGTKLFWDFFVAWTADGRRQTADTASRTCPLSPHLFRNSGFAETAPNKSLAQVSLLSYICLPDCHVGVRSLPLKGDVCGPRRCLDPPFSACFQDAFRQRGSKPVVKPGIKVYVLGQLKAICGSNSGAMP